MRKAIIASIAAIMFFIATPAVAFAHGGGGNSGHGSGHDRFERKFDHDRFDRDHFKRFPRMNFRNDVNISSRVSIVNNVTNSRFVRIRNIVNVNNTVNR